MVWYLAVFTPYHFMPGNSMKLLTVILRGITAHKSISIVLDDLGQERLRISVILCVKNSPVNYYSDNAAETRLLAHCHQWSGLNNIT